LIPECEISSERTEFFTNYGEKTPVQALVTDGTYRSYPDPHNPGIMLWKVGHNATFVLIIQWSDEEPKGWHILHVHFCSRRRLRKTRLKHELRQFNSTKLSPESLEANLSEILGT
jgi:hypothetical protein